MSISDHNFNKVANPKAKREAPFSLRLSFEERAALKKLAGKMPLGACIKAILKEAIAQNKGVPSSPAMDTEALGRVLGALGSSRLSQNVNQLAKAVNTGTLPVTPETEAELKEACRAIAEMRADLMRALTERGPS